MVVFNDRVWVILGKQLDSSSDRLTLTLRCCTSQGKYVSQTNLLSTLIRGGETIAALKHSD
jgi:hypothetical protein